MKVGPYRLSHGGTSLKRERRIRFRFDGKTFGGFEGDTLASALLANGVRTIGRSFKFHRPRGVFASGIEEPNAFVRHGTSSHSVPSTRSTLLELHEGLEAYSHAKLRFDVARVLDFSAPLWAAGFYNKTFIWPSWHAYEWLVRRMAGFGHAPSGADPDRYDTFNLHCDVLIIGGGVAGVQAANAAASNANARVVLVEQNNQLAGTCNDNIRILLCTTAIGCYDHNVVTLAERPQASGSSTRASVAPRERYWIVRADRIVLATGTIEQPLIFCNNDRPGVMLAGAAHQYLQRYGIAVGRRIVIATNNDTAYNVARDLSRAGVEVVALADSREEVPQELADEIRALSIPVLGASIPIDTSGFGALSGVSIGLLSRDAKTIESVQRYACDALAISGGWNPALQLYAQVGGKLIYSDRSGSLHPTTRGALWPATRHPSIEIVGAAAERIPTGPRISPVGLSSRKWVDLRHDVTVADLELAVREGYTSVEHAKRYTTVGMAADQGKTSHVASLEILAQLRGVKPSELGYTTLRPPLTPVTLGAIAGRATGERFAPSRRTPLHDVHLAHGAVFENYGEWKRPAVYDAQRHPDIGDDPESRQAAIRREARSVRTSAGLFDGSPLGKIEIHGPDALEFLDRFYLNNLRTLKPGRVRYGLMLRETGTIFDDGTVVMLAPDRFIITTTSGNAARVTAWLEEWHQCEWSHLRVAITQVTEQWAVLSLAGPHARDILSKLGCDIDLSNEAFPHLTLREGQLLGEPARIYRVSFSGELTYEVNVPASAAREIWRTILAAGAPYGLQPFGLEALLLMRMEKGFLHIGTDTDATTVPDDVGFGKIAASKAADFVGKRSLLLPENIRPDRLQLIGLTGYTDLIVGSHLRLNNSNQATDGWITSAGRSVLTAEPIAMAMLRGGRQRIGEQVSVHNADRVTGAKVVSPPFFDPSGQRMNF
jgi:sarcosine oxidase, subunit alpha